MTTKKCPFCDEEIHAQASSCEHCGRDFVKAVPDKRKILLGGVSLALYSGSLSLHFRPFLPP